MSVPFQRISNATVADIIFYDPAAERRASQMQIDWDTYFNVGSQEILYTLEFGWWPAYVDATTGGTLYANLPNGALISAFNPNLLIKSDQTLIRLDTFKAVETFYSSLVSDTSNVNSVDAANYGHALERYEKEYEKALQLMNFYDLFQDAPEGPTTKLEENWTADENFFNNNRRWF
jgi:hypothetical protein